MVLYRGLNWDAVKECSDTGVIKGAKLGHYYRVQ